VDVTIADLVADVRAATPTAAAELAVPLREDLLADLENYEARLHQALLGKAELLAARLSGALQRGPLRDPLGLVHHREQILDELSHRMYRVLLDRTHKRRRVLDGLEQVLQQIAPHTHLLRRAAELSDAEHRLAWAISHRMAQTERALGHGALRLEHVSPTELIPRLADRLDQLTDALGTSLRHRLSLRAERVRREEERLGAMSYKSVLGRGFSITRAKKGAKVVRSLKQLSDRQRIVTEITDGEFESEVVNLKQLELFE
jgi:exodeoxyribonuclease VII large subunit